ncbi:MAG: guanylate kinase [Thermodesulfobacteriota bacterium]
MTPIAPGNLYVISAPSGAGKSTLVSRLLSRVPALCYSISYTTRAPRGAEKDGVDYHFVTVPEFLAMIESGSFAEYAKVHDNYYGTGKNTLNAAMDAGRSVVLDIDVKGALQILAHYPDAVTVFIKPPSLDELENRLKKRGTDDAQTIAKRKKNAEWELAQAHLYRHVMVNDDLETATAELVDLIADYEKARRENR